MKSNTQSKKILVIDDDRESCEFLAEIFSGEGWQVKWAQSPETALEMSRASRFDLIVSDLNLEAKLNGIALLKEFKQQSPETQVILISGFGTLETAVQAVKEGAFDFISKPFKVHEVIETARRALEGAGAERASDDANKLLKYYESSELIGRSPKMIDLYNEIARVAPSRSTALIIGESGTGKELVARSLHNHSTRKDRPFVTVNCGALTETLLESELFGHVKGSFTGAVADKQGLFEEANGGTIFLDEIGETSLALQVKLLRVLQEGELKHVGSAKPIRVNVRVIAATNRNLEAAVKDGGFREDLYYRLSVVTLNVPPLREHMDDLPLLAAHFLKRISSEVGHQIHISDDAMALLMGYEWPGNIRELENAIEHAAIYAKGAHILPKDLPLKIQQADPMRVTKLDRPALVQMYEDLPSLDEMQRRYLQYVLEATGGNRTRAAEVLRIDRRTLYRMAERYGISLEEKEE